MKIVRRDYGQGAGKQEALLNAPGNELAIDRMIYRKMGSHTDNKVLTTPSSNSTDWERFLLDMNKLHNKKYYDDTILVTADLVALDKYLGQLGVSEIYPFKQDTYNSPNVLKDIPQTEYRVLSVMDTNGNDIEHLVDLSDDTVLVYYT